MTSHAGRIYAVALSLVVFFLVWAILAARPWASAAADPRLRVLARREAALREEARAVNAIVARRFATYRAALRARRSAIAAAAAVPAQSSVRVVMLPPLTITRTS
jgi:hypothetical protein